MTAPTQFYLPTAPAGGGTWYYEDDPQRAALCEAGVYDPLCFLYGGHRVSVPPPPPPLALAAGASARPVPLDTVGPAPVSRCSTCGRKAVPTTATTLATVPVAGAAVAETEGLAELPWWVIVLGLLVLAGVVDPGRRVA
jgi:hypothetical protein